MPLYEYYCEVCNKIYEITKSITDDQVEYCRNCSREMERLISRSNFVLKGGGWASDGYSKTKKTPNSSN